MKPFLIDSHAHVNFNAYKDDGDAVIRRSLDQDIWLINVGSQYDTSKHALEIANQYDEGVYAAIGLHPIHLSHTEVDEEEIHFQTREEQFDENKYQALIDADKNHKIVAVGEIGLDYYHIPEDLTLKEVKNRQAPDFIKQLHFAAKNNLPVIIHCRDSERGKFDAYQDTLDILKLETQNGLPLRGIKHSFDGNLEIAEEFFQLGFFVGFTGVITFGKNAEDLRQVARQLPLEKILVETDCPYLSPDPHRGERNEPSFVRFTAAKIAELKKYYFR
ncbi:MAG TPA: TatD family hydrolase [bacterium]|nr:TatD family hydrolase [bacterium]